LGRDLLVSLLWPDSEPEAGRHSLHQLQHAMRRAHAADDLFVGTTTLRLNPACLTTDVWDVESALDSRQLQQAVALYRGPFAHGLMVEGCEELERHLGGHRARFASEHATALETLATTA